MRRRARGVTLIETLAALALLGAVVPVVTRAWMVTLDVASRSRAEATAAVLGANLTEELLLATSSLNAEQGDFGDDYPGYTWKTELNEWSEDSSMRELTVVVRWERRSHQFEIRLATLVPASSS